MKKVLSITFILIVLFSIVVFGGNVETAERHKRIADNYLSNEKYEAAIAEYKIVLTFDPSQEIEIKDRITHCYSLLGIAKSKEKKWSEAAAAFNKSLELKADQPIIYYNLGVVYDKQGKKNDAIIAFQKFLRFPNAEKQLIPTAKAKIKKLGGGTDVKDHYIKGLELMTNDKLPQAKAEFLLVYGENKAKALEMIKIIEGLEKLGSTPTTSAPIGSDKEKVKNTIMTLGISFERKNIKVIRTLYSKSAASSIGGHEDIVAYYNDFWFTLFDNLKYKVTELNLIVDGDNAVVDCKVSISGIYSGEDMAGKNPKFSIGKTYSVSGKRQFILIKENNFWNITN